MKPDKIEYFEDNEVVVACINNGSKGMFLYHPCDGRHDWKFIQPGTTRWDALHQEIYYAGRYEICSKDKIETLPALPNIPDEIKFVKWHENFLPRVPSLSKEYPNISRFLKKKQNRTIRLYFILSEDTYETVFGDGNFLYHKKNIIFLSEQEATDYAARKNISKPSGKHGEVYSVRSIALAIKGEHLVSEDFKPSDFEHYYLKDIINDLESYLSDMASVITIFDFNTTLIWPGRKGDNIVWFGFKGMIANPENCVNINDVWELKDGDFITITNRVEDIPGWFELHPTEVSGRLVYDMMKKLENGYEPKDIADGPNIWRVKAGDRLAWVGKSRPGLNGVDGILAVLDFHKNALCLGDNRQNMSFEAMMDFGALIESSSDQEQLARCNAALKLIQKLGIPRIWAPEWKLG